MSEAILGHPTDDAALDEVSQAGSPSSDRRDFFRSFAPGMAVAAGAALLAATGNSALGQAAPTNGQILNFALNFEYLGAEFYMRAAFGQGLSDADISGRGTLGGVNGGRKVNFTTEPIASKLAQEFAFHELGHARILRAVLGAERIARPAIDLIGGFTGIMRATGVVGPNDVFDPFANDRNFLLAAYVLEDVCVTALRGGSGLLSAGRIVDIAAGLLGTEGYHGGALRALLHERGLFSQAMAISDARDNLDGPADLDVGVGDVNSTSLVPVDATALVNSRTPRQVLNIAYGAVNASSGGFFPAGVNGDIR